MKAMENTLNTKNNENIPFEKLKQSEIRYRRLFESAKDGILILDYDTGDIVDANPYIVKIIDYPFEEILGKKLWEIGLFSNKEESELAFIELQSTGYLRYEDRPIKRRNGRIKEVEFISNVYAENNNKVIQCNIRDITERKQNERKQELIAKLLSTLCRQEDWNALIDTILDEIKCFMQFDLVGMRLKTDEGYSFFEAIGFPANYNHPENCPDQQTSAKGTIIDKKNSPVITDVPVQALYHTQLTQICPIFQKVVVSIAIAHQNWI
jgi:PAS domain S-box-containing protein